MFVKASTAVRVEMIVVIEDRMTLQIPVAVVPLATLVELGGM